MPRLLTAAALALLLLVTGCQKQEAATPAVAPLFKAGDFTPAAQAEAFRLAQGTCTNLPLLLRFNQGEEPGLPFEWPGVTYHETPDLQLAVTNGAGEVELVSPRLAEAPTNLWLLAEKTASGLALLPAPFDAESGSAERWEAVFRLTEGAVSNAFLAELRCRAVLLAPQHVMLRHCEYNDLLEALASERECGTAIGRDALRIWPRFYIFLDRAMAAQRYEDIMRIGRDCRLVEGENAEWHAMQGDVIRVCDPTRIQEADAHYAEAMRLYAKKSRGTPFFRAWVAKTDLGAMTMDKQKVLALYYGILESVSRCEGSGAITREAGRTIRGRIYRNLAVLLLHYGEASNAATWARRFIDEDFTDDERKAGMELLFKAAEANGSVYEALANYDQLARKSFKERKVFWLLEKGVALVRFDLAEEATALYKEIQEADPELEERQLALPMDRRDVRFMRLFHYVRRTELGDMRESALAVLRRRAILHRTEAPFYQRQVANLLVCMQRLKEAFNTYNAISDTDNLSIIEHSYLLYRNSLYDQSVDRLKKLPYYKGSEAARDWRVMTLRLFRVKRLRPTLEQVLEEYAKIEEEVTPARYLNGLGNIYQAYRQLDKAAECFDKGIQSDPSMLDNYLDRGFLYCMAMDKVRTGEMLDRILALDLTPDQKLAMRYDWRAVELYFTAERPMPEETYE